MPTQLAISSIASGSPSRPAAQLGDRVRGDVAGLKLRQPVPALATKSRTASEDAMPAASAATDGQPERRHRPAHLAGHAEQYPAGDDDPQIRRRREQVADQARGLVAQRLGAVEHQQPRRTGERRLQRLGQRNAGLVVHAERDASAGASERGSRTDSSGRNTTSASGRLRLITSAASRVLPAPPGPIRLTSRASVSTRGQLGQFGFPADEARVRQRQWPRAAPGAEQGRSRPAGSPGRELRLKVRDRARARGDSSGAARTPTG